MLRAILLPARRWGGNGKVKIRLFVAISLLESEWQQLLASIPGRAGSIIVHFAQQSWVIHWAIGGDADGGVRG
jgi:hypothetical protein